MTRRLTLVALACAALALPSGATAARSDTDASATSARCQTVSYGGRTYVMYRNRVKCANSRRWIKRLHRTKRGPKGWNCGSGSNFRSGGNCSRGQRYFGWHPGD